MALRILLIVVLAAWTFAPQSAGEHGTQTAIIEGRVIDANTSEPLPDAHVFIARSMNGTTTDSSRWFRLSDVRPGAKRLYVSRVGHTNKAVNFRLRAQRPVTFTLRLEEEVLEAPPVTVSSNRDEEWYERLDRFKRLFVGQSPLAERCSLANPQVLRFANSWWGKFEAQAEKPLVIENRALGYRLKYFLKEFEKSGSVVRWDGEPLFTTLTPEDSLQAARWEKRRLRAYRGSLRHFLQALLEDRLEAEQFEMYRIPRASTFRYVHRADRLHVDREDVLEPGPDSTHLLNVSGRLEIVYRGEPESEDYLDWANIQRRAPRDFQTSQIELNQRPIHVDRDGKIVEPYGATLYQYFAYTMRMSDLLPREYEPPEDVPIPNP